MTLKEINEELTSYIADAEKLERVVEAFREMERKTVLEVFMEREVVSADRDDFKKFKAIIDE